MSFIVLSNMPGEESGTAWNTYQTAAQSLYDRCPSDRAYEDIMNGLAYLDDDSGQVVYYPCEDDEYAY